MFYRGWRQRLLAVLFPHAAVVFWGYTKVDIRFVRIAALVAYISSLVAIIYIRQYIFSDLTGWEAFAVVLTGIYMLPFLIVLSMAAFCGHPEPRPSDEQAI